MSTLADVVPMPAPRKRSHRLAGAYLTPEEIERVLTVALRHGRREHLMFLFAYVHGARVSEISHLKIADVNLERNTIRIERLKGSETNLQKLEKLGRRELFNERAAFIEWLQIRRAKGATDNDYMFPGRNGGALDRSVIFRSFQNIAEKAGLPASHSHVHVLKHSAGRHLVTANVNLSVIKKRLGHKSLSATAIYTTSTDSDASAAAHSALTQLFAKRAS